MNRQEQIATFKKLAAKNYSKGNWDTFTECYDDDDIADFFEGFDHFNSEKAIGGAMADIVSVWDDRHADAKHNAF